MANTWIEFKYAVEDLFDRVIVYTADANAHAFVGYSSNGTDWNYLSGEADHTLDGDELVTASGISEAETNYWQLSSGTNTAIYPAMIAGSYMRLYLTGSYTTTIYELVFFREVVAEMVVADTLAALSANCGTLTAGILQSSTYGADEGILVDLDNDRVILGGSSDPVMDIDANAGTGTFKGVFTFESATSGYSQITDKPTDLGDINSTEGTKLTGIDDGADVTDYTDTRVSNALSENNILTITRPVGASYSSSSGAIAGFIKVTLPQSWTRTMMCFIVDVYDYGVDKSFSLEVNGFNDSVDSRWEQVSASLVGSITANNRVRFAHDGTKCCVLIGDVGETWAYPKVSVRNFQGGYSNFNIDDWDDGWSISVLNSLSGITVSPSGDISDALIDAKAIKDQGDLAVQDRTDLDYTDGADSTDYTDTRVSNALSENAVVTISRPIGASYSGGSGILGAIKITLPQSWTNAMMKFTVDVFEYTTGLSFSLELSGYTYLTTLAWINTTANLTGSTAANNRVRFGHDGTKCCIYIGETTSSWSYPKISVRNFQAGHGGAAIEQWDDGWAISITTSIGTITSDISDSLIDANNTSNVGSLPSTTVQGWAHSSDTTKIDGGDIYTNTVTANQMAANTITANQMAANTITAGQIAADAITASEVGTNEIITYTANIKNAIISGAKIGNAEVDTLQLAGQSVTIPISSFSSAANGFSGENILSASITSTGSPIQIIGSLYCISVDSGAYFTMQLRRGSTILMTTVKDRGDNGRVVCTLSMGNTPGAGSYTYYLYVAVSAGTATAYGRSLLLLETKK